ncbi:MAG: PAS domain S-box protein [Bacteroidetes bacterium]|nr:MAG: PAS domain S-box protein [Bacteroidota bacterium]
MNALLKIDLDNKKHVFFLIVIISIFFCFGGYLYYINEKSKLIKHQTNELIAVADLKVNQIIDWNKSKIKDAEVITRSSLMIKRIQQFIWNSDDSSLIKDMKDRLNLFITAMDFDDIYLTDCKGGLLIHQGRNTSLMDIPVKLKVQEAISKKNIILSDIYYCPVHKKIHYEIISPIINSDKNPIAAIVFHIEPAAYLFPLLKSWPTPSKTAETMLLRKDGNRILVLNDLRLKKNSALNLQLPINNKCVMTYAVSGNKGNFEGKDYRGMDVLSHIHAINGTSWFMVSKVDKKEIYSDLLIEGGKTIGFVLLLILFTGAGFSYIYNSRQKNIYKHLFFKEKELWESHEEFKTTLYSIGDAVITTDINGYIKQMNPVAEKLTGWEEINAKRQRLEKIFHIISEDTRETVENPVQRVLNEGVIVGLANHTILISRDGREIPISDSGAPIRDMDKKIIGVVLIFRDQTEERIAQKKLYDSETRYRRLFEAAKVGIIILDSSTGRIVDLNPSMTEIAGYSVAELLGKQLWDIGNFFKIAPSEKFFLEKLNSDYTYNDDLQLMTKNNEQIDVEFVSNVYMVDNTRVIQCNIRDITEKKKAEEILKAERKRFFDVLETLPTYIILLTPDYQMTFANRVFRERFGEFPGRCCYEYLFNRKEPCENCQTFKALEKMKPVEWEWTGPDGKNYEVYDFPFVDIDGSKLILEMGIDITKRKLSEFALRESEANLREAQAIAHLGHWELDLINNRLTWSDEIYRIFGVEPQEFGASYDAFLNYVHPDDRDFVNDAYTSSVKNKTKYDITHRVLLKNGELKHVNEKCKTVYDKNGNPVCSLGTVHDITELKKIEEALRKLNRELRAISNCNQTLLRVVDEQTLLNEICRIICDDADYRLAWVGYVEHDDYKTVRPIAWAGFDSGYIENVKLTWAEDTERGQGPAGKAIRSGEIIYVQDFTIDPKMAPWRESALQRGYRSGIALPLKNESSEVFGVLLIYSSEPNAITPDEIRLMEELSNDLAFGVVALRNRAERKQAEEALQKGEARLKLQFNRMPIGCIIWNPEFRVLSWNPAAEKIFGFTAFESMDKHPYDLIVPIDVQPQVDAIWSRLLEGDTTAHSLNENLTKDGRTIICDWTNTPLKEADGRVVGVLSMVQDITERKQAEVALQEAEQKFRTIFNTATDGILIAQEESRNFFLANNRICEMLGYTEEELYNINVNMIHPQEALPYVLEQFEKQLRKEIIIASDIPVQKKDGTIFFADISSAPINFGGNKYLLGIFRDITERKRSEEQLKLFALILEHLNRQNEWQNLIKDILKEIKSYTGFDAVGIRLREGNDYPYYVQDGFNDIFIKEENFLCAKSKDNSVVKNEFGLPVLECTCGVVLSGKTDTSKPCFTEGGSFWTNQSTYLLDLLPNEDPRTNPRNNCIYSGYMSVALIPIRSGDEVIGLLQLNDKQSGRFNLDMIKFYEEIASAIGIAFNRMQSEVRIKWSEEKYRNLVDNAIVGVYKTNLNGDILYVNDYISKIFEFDSCEEMLKINVKTLYKDVDSRSTIIERIKTENKIENLELTMITKKGNTKHVLISETLAGDIMSGMMLDITKRKKAEKALIASEHKYSSLVENINDVIFSLTSEGVIDYISPVVYQVFGYTQEEVTGRSLKEFIYLDDLNYVLSDFNRVLEGEEISTDFRIFTKSLEIRWVHTSSRVNKIESNIIGLTGVLLDITTQKEAEIELIKAKEKAEEMNRLKSSFLANMSHELRTPMNGIMGFSQILQKENDIVILKEISGFIFKSSKRLMQTLNSILDLSRIEAGDLNPVYDIIDLIELVNESIGLYSSETQLKNIELKLESEFGKLFIHSDQRIIIDILNNLIDNAFKFTVEGCITIKVRKEILNNRDYAVIDVIDTGIGIDEKDYDTIFNEFKQLSEGLNRGFEGTGLGLTITKKYIEMLGGTIEVKSKPGVGSTFTVKLPDEVNEKTEFDNIISKKDITNFEIEDEKNNSMPLILYVENDEISIKYLKFILNDNAVIDFAYDGDEAIKSVNEKNYSIILMDINLGSGKNGIDVTKEIRNLEGYKRTPIIAITAFAMKGDREEFIASGCNDYLSKPFTEDELIQILSKYVDLNL